VIKKVKPGRNNRRANINKQSKRSKRGQYPLERGDKDTDHSSLKGTDPFCLTAAEVLGEVGPLSKILPGFQARQGQIEMATAVEQAIASSETLVAEAGTGIGKTFAYLAPAIMSGAKVIISTGTKHLQDQLFHKDLPTLRDALKINLDAVLLKGRANYLCHYRLKKSLTDSAQQGHSEFVGLKGIELWASETKSGDKAEYQTLAEDHHLWPRVTSTVENCLGQECPDYGKCFVVKARRAAQDADLVVINHHLFCADLALRDSGFGELLPDAEAIIIDEAHQLPEVATRFFGRGLTSRQLQDLAKDTLAELLTDAADMPELLSEVQGLPQSIARLRYALGREGQKAAWQPMLDKPELKESVEELDKRLVDLAEHLEAIAERSQGLQTCHSRSVMLRDMLTSLQKPQDKYVHWFETTRQGFLLHQTPLDIAEIFQEYQQGLSSTWIFTSATLAVGQNFSHFCRRLGIENNQSGQWKSPFDYENHSLLFAPEELPEPNAPDYTQAVMTAVKPFLEANSGGSFFLFTSYRALQIAAETLVDSLDKLVLVQGDAPRQILLEQFRKAGNAVLLATSSFWEGVDVRGDALSCVIIDKLPFASPGEPVLEARLAAMREQGQNPFMDYQLPQAVITLKQGAGRLIRDVNDRGLLVICDPRLRNKPYGKRFISSLPPMPRTTDFERAMNFLVSIK